MTQRFGVLPWQEAVLAGLLGLLGLSALSVVVHDPAVGLGMGGLLLAMAAGLGWVAWTNAARVELSGATLRVTQRGRVSVLAAQAVRAVVVSRPLRPPLPTTVYLLAEGRQIPVARFSLIGRGVLQRAEGLARHLGVDLRDPEGDQLRRSRFALLRWRGAGDEWAFLGAILLVVVPLVGAVVGAQLR